MERHVVLVLFAATLLSAGVLPARTSILAQQQTETPPVPARTLEEFAGPDTLTERSAGVTRPKTLLSPAPRYTPSAQRARVEGTVELFALVGRDGKVARSQVAQALHPDLDAEALRTLALWQFEPGRLNGAPIPMAIIVRMEFRIYRQAAPQPA